MKLIMSLFILLFITIATAQESLSPSEKSEIVVVVDNDYPIITILNPGNISYNNATPLLVNYTIFEISLDSVWYSLNDKENITIFAPFYISLPEGDYFLKIYANDSFNRINLSEAQFKINSFIPACGDNICNQAETCSICSADCGICPPQNKNTGNSGGGGGSDPAETEVKDKNKTLNNKTELEISDNLADDKPIVSDKSNNKNKELNYQIVLIAAIIIIILVVVMLYIFINARNKNKKWKAKKQKPSLE